MGEAKGIPDTPQYAPARVQCAPKQKETSATPLIAKLGVILDIIVAI